MMREGAARLVLLARSFVLWTMGGGARAEDALFRLAQWIRRT